MENWAIGWSSLGHRSINSSTNFGKSDRAAHSADRARTWPSVGTSPVRRSQKRPICVSMYRQTSSGQTYPLEVVLHHLVLVAGLAGIQESGKPVRLVERQKRLLWIHLRFFLGIEYPPQSQERIPSGCIRRCSSCRWLLESYILPKPNSWYLEHHHKLGRVLLLPGLCYHSPYKSVNQSLS